MSKTDKIDKINNIKPFRLADVIVYIVLAVLIVALLLAFCLPRQDSSLRGVEVTVNGEIVAEYYFEDDSLVTAAVVDSRREGDKYYLTVHTDQPNGYNLVVIDVTEHKAWVQEADCSSSAECTQMKAITKAGDSIICIPHALVVQGVGDGEAREPISG
ncbi:MAG: NusG domain II-containing protein [Clostridia bacterium]|nr:NusG domain II-containing protein [Clostridia bacterium]MDY4083559.1 NusG domain II-containing protein [Eubacteriales bacterium]